MFKIIFITLGIVSQLIESTKGAFSYLRGRKLSNPLFFGDMTSYGADIDNGFCGFKKDDWNYNNVLTAAINHEQIDNSLSCGKCVNIYYNNEITTALIDNICPECKYGDLDLSTELWNKVFNNNNPSRYKLEWEFTHCDNFIQDDNYNIKLRDYDPNNNYWFALTPFNYKCGIKDIKIQTSNDNEPVSLDRNNNYMNGLYFIYNRFIDKSIPFNITIINIYDEYILISDIYRSENIISSNKQFECNRNINCI